jgi:SAM-dependent methyltransferase
MTVRADVDAEGLVVPASVREGLDVLFDGRRVWSFDPPHEGVVSDGVRTVPWPQVLAGHLDGVVDVEVVEHVSRRVMYAGPVRFGSRTGRAHLVDRGGRPLSVDKSGRLQRDFDTVVGPAREQVMDALEQVVRDLTEVCGLDVYLMYGCLLGAVREGHLIGHDSDVDLAYLSPHTHPIDIIRECRTAIRRMRERGWVATRMSDANFKVWVPLPDGQRCGIDVFGSFYVGERFIVTGSLTGTLDRSALVPFGTVTLEGREIVAPARPEEVLEFTYGPGWRVPDPAFHLDHDPVDVRRMDDWFRGMRRRYRFWDDFYKSPVSTTVPAEASLFAHWVAARLDGPAHVLDVGAGTGRDAAHFAANGHRVTALDFSPRSLLRTQALCRGRSVTVARRRLNLEDLRSVLVAGAAAAHRPGRHQVYARGLLDALSPNGRDNFWRFASLVQRRGGETFLEFRTPRSLGEPTHFGMHRRTFLEPDEVVRQIEAHHGHVVHLEAGRDLAPLGEENPHVCRIVARWAP